MVIWLCRLPF
jgi:hypothetical protein